MNRFPEPLRVRAAVAALIVFASCAVPAAAQVTVGTPVQFAPPGPSTGYGPGAKFKSGFANSLDVFSDQGARRLLMIENFGYTVYDLADPAVPATPVFCDVEAVYHKAGDGFSTVFSVGASADGSRIMVGYLEPHGNLLMGRGVAGAPGCTFNFAGEYAPARGVGEAVASLPGGRYLSFSVAPNGGVGLYVAEATNFLSGPAAQVTNSIQKEAVPGTTNGQVSSTILVGHYLLYLSSSSLITVVDFANAGPVGSIASGLVVNTFSAASFGFGAGVTITHFAAAIHPSTSALTVLAEGGQASGGITHPQGFAAATITGGSVSTIGPIFVPPNPWSGNAATTSPAAAVTTSNDVLFFAWAHESDPSANKLFAFSADSWGTDLSPNAIYVSSDFPSGTFSQVAVAKAVQTREGQMVVYFATGEAGYAIPVSLAAPAPTHFYTLDPCRLFDTRDPSGPDAAAPALGAGETRVLDVSGRCGVPATARSLSVNITSTGGVAEGYLSLFRADPGSAAVVSQNVFHPGTTRATSTLLELSRDGSGTFSVFNGSSGMVHFILDVSGYFQ